MDFATLAQIGGSILGIGAAAFGELWSRSDQKKRDALLQQAQQIYSSMSPPQLQALTAEQVGPSAFDSLPTDFGNKDLRNRALQQIMGIGEQGGMDPGSQLALEQARQANAQQAAQQEGAVRQQFQARGLGGAGEASLQLQEQQAGAQRASLAGMQAAADARSRALQALMSGEQGAQQAESADFEQAARRAASDDAIAQFNANLRQGTNQFNSGLQQQNFQNQLSLADRQYGATRARAGDYETEAQRKRRMLGTIGGGLTDIGSSFTRRPATGGGMP